MFCLQRTRVYLDGAAYIDHQLRLKCTDNVLMIIDALCAKAACFLFETLCFIIRMIVCRLPNGHSKNQQINKDMLLKR